ncbi:MAG: sulfatase [Verrucomicrobiales bacterium]|nr:sulfatase [Verrucomicrobiales bacterium]
MPLRNHTFATAREDAQRASLRSHALWAFIAKPDETSPPKEVATVATPFGRFPGIVPLYRFLSGIPGYSPAFNRVQSRTVPCLIAVFLFAVLGAFADDRPNILWITIEDWSPDLSCYGTKGIQTPHVDKLASEGIRYQWAFTTSPVCSTSRSAMMTGFHQNYIGANQHREHNKAPLPYGIKPVPHLFREAGYHTSLLSWKTDCNFTPNTRSELFEGGAWKERKPGQPFFARVTFGGTHRSWNRDPERPIDPNDVELPPYYPDTPFVRRDWANGLEQMQLVDREVGEILKRLDDEGLRDNTIVFFIGDHGRCHIRGKQFLYDGGIRIPMIMRWPGKVEPGQVSENLVMSIDICQTILEAAGIEPSVPLHGRSLFSDEVKNRKYVFAARDKMDETHDAMRAIRSKDHKLILNLMPERPWCQYNRYKEGAYPVLAEMNILNLQGKLTPEQAAFMAPSKPDIELFDLQKDPANDPAYAEVKAELLAELEKWRKEVIHDKGVTKDFRAEGIFPETNPVSVLDDWAEANVANYDFNLYGWPAWYPTRNLEEWEKARKTWEPWVFRSPTEKMARPNVVHTKKMKKKAKKH